MIDMEKLKNIVKEKGDDINAILNFGLLETYVLIL